MLASNRVTSVSTMDEVNRTARQLGVAVKIDGYLPRDTAAEELTVAAAKECVTNCIKHADGNEVYIRIAQRGERYDVTITNNGKIPTEPIRKAAAYQRFAAVLKAPAVKCIFRTIHDCSSDYDSRKGG